MGDFLPLTYNTLIVLAGTSLLGANAGWVGSYAVLRRRALMGDALSHAALPGLCLAFLAWGERSLPVLLLGALASGLLGVAVVAGLRSATRVKEDAAIGIVLGVFFGAGYVLSQLIQKRFTSGSKAGLDSYILGKTAGMIYQDVLWIGGVSLAALVVVLLFYKEFKIVAFDPGFARVQGWPALGLDAALMGLIAVTIVVGLPAVGVILMSALLIIPAAAARFWTDRLGTMLLLSTLFGAAIGSVGTLLSAQFRWVPAGPVIVLTGTALFLISMLLAPRRGLIARGIERRAFRQRIRRQNLLRLICELSVGAESPRPFTLTELLQHSSEPLERLRQVVQALVMAGEITVAGENYRLTDRGLAEARRLVRGQRLWTLFLTEHADLASSYADLDATSLDEVLPAELVRELELKHAAREGTR